MDARRAQEAAQKADAAGLCLSGLNRWTFQRAGAALPRARTTPQWRLRLVTGQMPPLRDLRQPSP
jgi:hypothetical protein